jgi:hypothetical protein
VNKLICLAAGDGKADCFFDPFHQRRVEIEILSRLNIAFGITISKLIVDILLRRGGHGRSLYTRRGWLLTGS